jgi:hypothetical protein
MMATPTPSVRIKLGNEEYKLRFDSSAIYSLEEKTGQTLSQMALSLGNASFVATCHMLWAGLLHGQPDITVSQVIRMVDLRDLNTIAEKLNEALELALGPAPKVEGDEGKASAA